MGSFVSSAESSEGESDLELYLVPVVVPGAKVERKDKRPLKIAASWSRDSHTGRMVIVRVAIWFLR